MAGAGPLSLPSLSLSLLVTYSRKDVKSLFPVSVFPVSTHVVSSNSLKFQSLVFRFRLCFQFPVSRLTFPSLSFLVSRFLVLVSRPLELIEHRQSFRCFSHSSRSRRSGTLVTFGMSCLNKKVTFLLVWFRTRAVGVVPRLCFRPFPPESAAVLGANGSGISSTPSRSADSRREHS